MKRKFLSLSLIIIVIANIFSQSENQGSLYFPPLSSDSWEKIDINKTGWNISYLQHLMDYIKEKSTKAFIILKDGKIVLEWYDSDTNAQSNLPWYSAGKTLVAFTVGIAQDEGHLNINHSSSIHLGTGWSNMTEIQESKITVKHHMTMTTGLDYTIFNKNCTAPRCLNFKYNPSEFWYYHNAAYTKIQAIVTIAVNQSFEDYFNKKLRDKIGMQGEWKRLGFAKPYYSNARSMARFGLLNLNKGYWGDTPILKDSKYFSDMTNTSQDLNKSYGYLWWLNGKDNFKLPGLTKTFNGKLIPNAPDDLIAGLGKNDQKLYVVPSKNLVIVRMGDKAKKTRFGPSNFDNELWDKLNKFFAF
ncbi:serine hydrolase domain-containing protein [Seonamhaeicola aphaedonensis]|uniref:CubicO group peptidase (Beta-lactamase class C family) n=1 Tax=Seonamhaeicola aphaedonensis TaxID=1461338 RepID=A0A3D9HHG9_9FLAO|nr:serine hydrolase domain-containing protein [Seonamhaeicola aphaedonensis]RED48406.1 CubicO group peptidase (beta-lactamase class C family) [Seonamhaeicola aphaedonensis]